MAIKFLSSLKKRDGDKQTGTRPEFAAQGGVQLGAIVPPLVPFALAVPTDKTGWDDEAALFDEHDQDPV